MNTREFKFANGDTVREKITGFQGVITGTAFYLTGCNSHLVTTKPKDEFSEPISLWYDDGRLELIESTTVKETEVQDKKPGADWLPNVGKKGY